MQNVVFIEEWFKVCVFEVLKKVLTRTTGMTQFLEVVKC
jgi:hypothetical protein